MNRFCSIFNQLLQLFPRDEFQRTVREHRAERHARGFTCWGQFVAMLFCHLGKAHSLREICGGLASCEGKLAHLGIHRVPNRSTLSYANEHRPWELYEAIFYQLLERCRQISGKGKRFRFKNKLVSMDGALCGSAPSPGAGPRSALPAWSGTTAELTDENHPETLIQYTRV